MAALVAVDRGQEKLEAAATRLQLAQVRVTTAVLAIPVQKPIVVVEAALALLAVLQVHPRLLGVLAAMAAQELHQQFLAYLQLTLAVAADAQSLEPQEAVALVAVALVPLQPITQQMQQPILVVVAVAQETTPIRPA
jgi:hypothetical protein